MLLFGVRVDREQREVEASRRGLRGTGCDRRSSKNSHIRYAREYMKCERTIGYRMDGFRNQHEFAIQLKKFYASVESS